MKIVINDCHGGFGLSDDAFKIYLDRKGIKYIAKPMDRRIAFEDHQLQFNEDAGSGAEGRRLSSSDIDRSDEVLVRLVEELGEEANSWAADLKIVEIPDDVEWQIEEYDGSEWVAEKHRTWR
jgi:hypothetical protein